MDQEFKDRMKAKYAKPAEPAKPGPTLRDSKGRWLKGTPCPNRTGSRRPSTKVYYNALAKVVTPEKWKAICETAVRQAIKGDRHARKWIGEYLMGKPVQYIEADIDTRGDLDAAYIRILNRVYGDG